jgi:DNA-binding protein H-NS
MARTLAQIQQQIDKPQQEAEKVKAKEVAGVIERIKAAIAFYSLTPADLFVTRGRPPGKPKKAASKKATAKYRDKDTGKTWTGHGKRPGWFVKAIEAGVNAEEMAA